VDKDIQDDLIADVASLKTDMTWVKKMLGNMTWVKKMLGNHYQFQQKLIVGLIFGLLGLISSLIVILVR